MHDVNEQLLHEQSSMHVFAEAFSRFWQRSYLALIVLAFCNALLTFVVSKVTSLAWFVFTKCIVFFFFFLFFGVVVAVLLCFGFFVRFIFKLFAQNRKTKTIDRFKTKHNKLKKNK